MWVCPQNWPKTFLAVNALTFGLGIVSVMYATLIGNHTGNVVSLLLDFTAVTLTVVSINS